MGVSQNLKIILNKIKKPNFSFENLTPFYIRKLGKQGTDGGISPGLELVVTWKEGGSGQLTPSPGLGDFVWIRISIAIWVSLAYFSTFWASTSVIYSPRSL